MELIISFIVGALISWAITHHYYKKASRDQKELFAKLPDSFRQVVLESRAEKFSVKELNKLLEEKIYDEDSGRDPLPYKCCPRCGSTKLKRSSMSDDRITMFYISCEECDWGAGTE